MNQLPIDKRFAALKAQWQKSQPPYSSSEKLAMLPAYQQIIGLGPAVLPYLFGELERSPDHWFWAYARLRVRIL